MTSTQKKWKNQGVSSGSREASARDNQKLTLTADYQKNQNKKPFYSGTKAFNTAMCPLCRTKHAMWKCTKFLALRAKERQSVIKKFKLCFHCLGSGHRVSACRFYPKQLCGVKGCQRFHHRLLHPSTNQLSFMKTEIAIAALYLTLIKSTLMTWSLVVTTLTKFLSNQKLFTLMFLVWPEMELSVCKP